MSAAAVCGVEGSKVNDPVNGVPAGIESEVGVPAWVTPEKYSVISAARDHVVKAASKQSSPIVFFFKPIPSSDCGEYPDGSQRLLKKV